MTRLLDIMPDWWTVNSPDWRHLPEEQREQLRQELTQLGIDPAHTYGIQRILMQEVEE